MVWDGGMREWYEIGGGGYGKARRGMPGGLEGFFSFSRYHCSTVWGVCRLLFVSFGPEAQSAFLCSLFSLRRWRMVRAPFFSCRLQELTVSDGPLSAPAERGERTGKGPRPLHPWRGLIGTGFDESARRVFALVPSPNSNRKGRSAYPPLLVPTASAWGAVVPT